MTKKDFELIAKVINTCACVSREDVAMAFAEALAGTNNKFNEELFLRKCLE